MAATRSSFCARWPNPRAGVQRARQLGLHAARIRSRPRATNGRSPFCLASWPRTSEERAAGVASKLWRDELDDYIHDDPSAGRVRRHQHGWHETGLADVLDGRGNAGRFPTTDDADELTEARLKALDDRRTARGISQLVSARQGGMAPMPGCSSSLGVPAMRRSIPATASGRRTRSCIWRDFSRQGGQIELAVDLAGWGLRPAPGSVVTKSSGWRGGSASTPARSLERNSR